MIYVIILLIVAFGALYFDSPSNRPGRKGYLAFEWLILVLVSGLRYKIGGDTIAYMDNYPDSPTFEQFTSFDFVSTNYNFLWYAFVASCKLVSQDYFFMQMMHSIIVNSIVIWFFRRHTKFIFTAIFFYVLFFYLNFNTEIMRASLAVCAFLIGYDYLVKKRWIHYAVICAIAYGFHSEAAVLILFPFCHYLNKIHFDITTVSFLIIVSFVVLFTLDFVPYLSQIEYWNEFAEGKIETYGERGSLKISTNAIIMRIVYIAPAILALWINDKKGYAYKGLLIIFVFTYIQATRYHVLFGRPLDFLKPIYVLAIADALEAVIYFKVIKFYELSKILIVVSLFSGSYQYLEGGYFPYWKRYYPYSSIINPQENSEREINMYYYNRSGR